MAAVLYADHHPRLEGVKNILETAGYNVETALDFSSLMQKAETNETDVILINVHISRDGACDGYDAIEALRTNTRTESLPIVALWTMAQDGTVLNEGGYATKREVFPLKVPCPPEEIIGAVEGVLGSPTNETSM